MIGMNRIRRWFRKINKIFQLYPNLIFHLSSTKKVLRLPLFKNLKIYYLPLPKDFQSSSTIVFPMDLVSKFRILFMSEIRNCIKLLTYY